MQLSGINFKYLYDKDREKLKAIMIFKKFLEITDNLNEVLDDGAIDAVVVATPASTHYEIAKTSLEAGKHVLVEKSLAMDYKQACELSELSEKLEKSSW
jgi:predicted dehydrogenase